MIRKLDIVKVLVSALTLAMIATAWLHPLDASANEKVDRGLRNAVATYATARVLHGIISVFQGIQINLEPAGIGTTLAPGQALAPAAEMLKQFSDVMLVVCVAFGIEKLLMTISAHAAVTSVLTAISLGWLAMFCRSGRPPEWLSKILLLFFMVQFAVPLTLVGSEKIYEQFLAREFQTSKDGIQLGVSEASSAPEPVTVDTKEVGALERMKDWFGQRTRTVAQYEKLKKIAMELTEHVVTIIAVFVLQTMIVPLALLWAIYTTVKRLLGWPGGLARAQPAR